MALGLGSFYYPRSVKKPSFAVSRETVTSSVGPSVKNSIFPTDVEVLLGSEKVKASIEYTLNSRSQILSDRLFQSYKPDYGAFVALDARTGKILTLSSYTRTPMQLGNLALRASFPAASVFKMVTAAAAIDQKKFLSNSVISFNGRSHTLYKKNLSDVRVNRWTRYFTLKQAFAQSVNTVFAKLGVFYVGADLLKEYASRFMFNTSVAGDIPMDRGLASIPANDEWAVAETASGYTKSSTMSPLHGALMAAAVANDGIMMQPYIVQRLSAETGESLYEGVSAQISNTMAPQSAAELRVLMHETIMAGTSRKTFRKIWGLKKYKDLDLGGKTGSLTGLDPRGKYDWFVGYLRYRGQRIAVAALTINQDKWRVKSSYLAGKFFEDYLSQIESQRELVLNQRQQ